MSGLLSIWTLPVKILRVHFQVVSGDTWRWILSGNECTEIPQFVTRSLLNTLMKRAESNPTVWVRVSTVRREDRGTESAEGEPKSYLRRQSQQTSMSEWWKTQSCTCFRSLVLLSLLEETLCGAVHSFLFLPLFSLIWLTLFIPSKILSVQYWADCSVNTGRFLLQNVISPPSALQLTVEPTIPREAGEGTLCSAAIGRSACQSVWTVPALFFFLELPPFLFLPPDRTRAGFKKDDSGLEFS